MKIRIDITLDINPDAWKAEYGVEREDIREDVKRHVRDSVIAHFDSLGLTT